jgi:hypothetical protein
LRSRASRTTPQSAAQPAIAIAAGPPRGAAKAAQRPSDRTPGHYCNGAPSDRDRRRRETSATAQESRSTAPRKRQLLPWNGSMHVPTVDDLDRRELRLRSKPSVRSTIWVASASCPSRSPSMSRGSFRDSSFSTLTLRRSIPQPQVEQHSRHRQRRRCRDCSKAQQIGCTSAWPGEGSSERRSRPHGRSSKP